MFRFTAPLFRPTALTDVHYYHNTIDIKFRFWSANPLTQEEIERDLISKTNELIMHEKVAALKYNTNELKFPKDPRNSEEIELKFISRLNKKMN